MVDCVVLLVCVVYGFVSTLICIYTYVICLQYTRVKGCLLLYCMLYVVCDVAFVFFADSDFIVGVESNFKYFY